MSAASASAVASLIDAARVASDDLVAQVSDGVEERPTALGDHEVDRVEVPFAGEAPCEVRSFVHARVEAFALRATKRSSRTTSLGRDAETIDNVGDPHVVA